MTVRVLEVIVVLIIACGPRVLLGQSSELDPDGESVAETCALEETLERLRSTPIDLRTATVDDLLQIPGLHRREAERIVQAVRSNMVVELRSIDLLFGVRPGTSERLAPYVTLANVQRPPPISAKVRAQATIVDQGNGALFVRDEFALHVEEQSLVAGQSKARFDLRRAGPTGAGWFLYARIPSPAHGWVLTLGDLSVQNGSSLLDRGRRTSILRPSDWERRSTEGFKVRPGYDPITSIRGLTVEYSGGGRTFMASVAEREHGEKVTTFVWSEQWPGGLELHCVREAEGNLTAIRLSTRSHGWEAALEAAYGEISPSYAASARWEHDGRAEVKCVLRRLRDQPGAGVPRAGGRSLFEDAVATAVQFSPHKGLRFHAVGDVGGWRQREDRTATWDLMSSVGFGCVANLPERAQAGLEWTHSQIGTAQTSRWSTQVRQQIASRLVLQVTMIRRSETDEPAGGVAGRLTHATLTWKSPTIDAAVRWLSGGGDPAVEFWVLGPGPSSLNGLFRSSGRAGQVQGVLLWRPRDGVEIGAAASLRYLPVQVLRSSIRVEIQL